MSSLDSMLKSRDITLPTKIHLVKGIVFPVILYGCELAHKESWVPKNWCFSTVVLEKTLENLLDFKEIQPVHPKYNQSRMFIGWTHLEAETPKLWPPDGKNWLTGKDPDAWKDWRQEEKGVRGWDGWMASLTQCTWIWVNSWSWWWTGRPGVLESMQLQRIRQDWATELTDWCFYHMLEQQLHHTRVTLRRYSTSRGKGEAPERWYEGLNHIQNQTPHLTETLRELKHTLCTSGPRATRRLRQNCVWVCPEEIQVSSGLPQEQGLWVQ